MKFVLKLISVITAIVSKLWPYRIMGYAKYLIGFFYSQWICRSLNYDRSNYFGRRFVISGHEKVKIGVKNAFGHDMMISVWEGQKSCNLGQVTIGNNCDFGYFNHITCCNKITIGNGVLTGMYVIISDNNHGHLTLDEQIMRPVDRPLHSKGEVVIGDNVWIGDKVAILAGVHIGEGAVVAANAVVTRDVAANTVVAGAPAKVIKEIK